MPSGPISKAARDLSGRSGADEGLPAGIRSWGGGRVAQESDRHFNVVVIGCSMGGMHALEVLLGRLPSAFPHPILVVQHRYRTSGDALPEHLRRHTALGVVDAGDKQWIRGGTVYLAPADYHLLVDRDGELSLSLEAAVAWSRPSVDVLFESAAEAYGAGVVAVVLTGANSDGARGAALVKQAGGLVVVQDPKAAEAPSMPAAALAATRVDRILPLDRIGPFLIELCRDRR